MKLFSLILMTFCMQVMIAQEVLKDIIANPAIGKEYKERMSRIDPNRQMNSIPLPFVDDFSQDHFLGNEFGYEVLWEDLSAYRNLSFGINPPTVGVATFDGLNAMGFPHNNFTGNTIGSADTLTSVGIDLESAGNNVVFSFYFQAKGVGNAPQPNDVLSLEFLDVDNGIWDEVWSTPGILLGDFQQVLIAIEEDKYLKDNFQFRFRNIANLTGAFDHWHIDYVHLGDNRNLDDIPPNDVCFAEPIYSLLEDDYTSMPWTHYMDDASDFVVDSKEVIMRNLRTAGSTVNGIGLFVRYDEIVQNDFSENIVYTLPASTDLAVSQIVNSGSNDYFFSPTVNDTSATFEVYIGLNSSPNVNADNDVLNFMQRFENYYDYSDNTAENAILINGLGSAAYRIDAVKEDTLQAIQISFLPVGENSENENMFVTVWDDDGFGGSPGTILYQSENIENPDFTDLINGYKRYVLEEKVFVGTTYYIGWKQTTANGFGVGNDVSRNNNTSRFFFNTNGSWTQSSLNGSLMIRPEYVSLIPPPVGINEITENIEMTTWPNPVDDYLNIESNNFDKEFSVSVFDMKGRLLDKLSNPQYGINTEDYPEGLYLLTFNDANNKILLTKKIIVIHK